MNLRSIQCSNRIFGIAAILKFDESESRWIASYPDILEWAKFRESALHIGLETVILQIANVDLAVRVPAAVCHRGSG